MVESKSEKFVRVSEGEAGRLAFREWLAEYKTKITPEEHARIDALSESDREIEIRKLYNSDVVREKREAAERFAHRANWLFDVGVPPRLIPRLMRSELSDETRASAQLRDALRARELLIVLSGPPGCGKTTAACIAIHRLDQSAIFLSAWNRSRLSIYEEDAQEMADVGVLVIDDVGEEYADTKGFSLSVLDQLITQRYDNQGVTIITTNLTAVRFRERCGERIADRIREVGVYIELSEASMRKKADS